MNLPVSTYRSDVELMRERGLEVRYISPPWPGHFFGAVTMAKVFIFQLQYDRVLYIDSDILPSPGFVSFYFGASSPAYPQLHAPLFICGGEGSRMCPSGDTLDMTRSNRLLNGGVIYYPSLPVVMFEELVAAADATTRLSQNGDGVLPMRPTCTTPALTSCFKPPGANPWVKLNITKGGSTHDIWTTHEQGESSTKYRIHRTSACTKS